FVEKRDRRPIHFELCTKIDLFFFEKLTNSFKKIANLFFRIGISKRHHGNFMRLLNKSSSCTLRNSLRRRVGMEMLRMSLFIFDESSHLLVIFEIGDDWFCLIVIVFVMLDQFIDQLQIALMRYFRQKIPQKSWW